MSNEPILKAIKADLLAGKRLMITDAAKYGSSQSAFSRRIKDLRERGVDIHIEKVILPKKGSRKFSKYFVKNSV